MDEFVEAIERLGFRVRVARVGRGYVSLDGRQVAVFRVNRAGDFEWGWVETAKGRTDEREFGPWLRALQKWGSWL